MAVLEMKGICYAYEKGRPILSDINTEFEVGKMYAVLGPSGSGKTTMLSLIGGLDIPQKGEILFSGENISQCGLACHRRSHVSLIFQSYNLIDYMTPMENVALTAKKDVLPLLLRLGLLVWLNLSMPSQVNSQVVKNNVWQSPAPWPQIPRSF